MLSKILNSLNRIGRNWSYFMICLIIAIAINLINTHPLRTQTPPFQTVPETYVDAKEFSKMITKIENKWESDYENYFQRNFSNRSRSAKQIAKHLTKISQQTNTKAAVIWAIPKKDLLQLLLITPNGKFVVNAGTNIEIPITNQFCNIALIFEFYQQNWLDFAVFGYQGASTDPATSIMVHTNNGIDVMKESVDLAYSRKLDYIFVTDDTVQNTWTTLGSYWTEFTDYLAQKNAQF